MNRFFAIMLCIALNCGCWALNNDTIEFSLLTCYPGNHVYSLYGHTAIRYLNKSHNEDFTFNYGMFNFRQKNFVWNFALGKTDYELGVCRFTDFVKDYELQGRRVVEQVLNMTDGQKEVLRFLLFQNWRPENATYRYNYFYDNCTSRARNIIFEAINSDSCQIVFKGENTKSATWRENLHQYSKNHPWAQLGNDLALGQPADRQMSEEESQFLPLNMMDDMNKAMVVTDSMEIPLVSCTNIIAEGNSKERFATYQNEFVLTPLQCAAILALICVVVFFIELKRRKIYLWFDVLLMAVQGAAGCVLTLLLFSDHPAIFMNWQILVICPLAILAIPFVVIADRKKKISQWFLYEILACLALFIIDAFGVQDIPLFSEIMAMCLLTRILSRKKIFAN